MDNETYLVVSRVVFLIGFVVSGLVWLFYTIVAPWYKVAAGRYIWSLLLAIFLVLSVSVVRLVFGDFPFRREIAIGAFVGFLIALLSVGIGIYRAQIASCRKKRFIKEFRESHRSD